MHTPQDNNSTPPRRRRNYRHRPVSGHSQAVQTTAPQASSSPSNDNTSMDDFHQSHTSSVELVAELESMLATLRQCMDEERGHLRPRVPSANNGAASDAEDIHAKINRIESNVNRMKEELSSLIHLRETDQNIVRLESDVGEIKRELAGLSSVRVTLAELQAQLQMLLNTCMIHSQFPSQMYPSAQPPPYN